MWHSLWLNVAEDQVIPLYYKMSENGIPPGWVRLMKRNHEKRCNRFFRALDGQAIY